MKTYVIANLKGGVGKTTSAVNIGFSMAKMGKRVLLCGCRPTDESDAVFYKITWREWKDDPRGSKNA